MVQNFVFFADRLGAVKIRIVKSGENVMSYMQSIDVGVVSTWEGAKIKTTKTSAEGLTYNSAKNCTSENFPLYGM
jgi:hypothetical protein